MDRERSVSKGTVLENKMKRLSFGTGGIRAIMGPAPDQMNIENIQRNTEGYARYVLDKGGKSVVIAYDNRRNSETFAAETARVLASHRIHVFLFDSLRPTPELSFAVPYLGAFGGIVITASHNPPEYNGYKIYDRYGCQCVPRDTDEIIRYINAVPDEWVFRENEGSDRIECESVQTGDQESELSERMGPIPESESTWIEPIGEAIDEAYYEKLLTVQQRPEFSKDLKIVYTPLHGTGYVPVTTMLRRLGYSLYEVEEQCDPDPDFSRVKSPNPEDKAAFDEAIELAKQVDADLILATDPDCDRIGLVVKHHDSYEYLTGNRTGAILIQYLLQAKKEAGTLSENGILFDTIVTSDLGAKIAKSYGVEVESTLTGFKFIGDKIREYEGKKTFLFGYEESYGYMIGGFTRDKDGVQAAILAAEVCNYYKSKGLTLVDVLESIYREYGRCTDIQESKTLPGEDGRKRMEELVDEYRNIDPVAGTSVIEGRKVVAVEDYKVSLRRNADGSITQLSLPKSNVIKLILEVGSWVVVRPSGNEPKIKYYKDLWEGSDESYKV